MAIKTAIVSPYVDYSWYSTEYFGNQISSEAEFSRIVKRVTPILDEMTFDRLKSFEAIPDIVKDALCAMCDAYQSLEITSTERKLASESNDGYSVTYRQLSPADVAKGVMDEARSYLANTGLLYKGVRRSDYKSDGDTV